MSVCINKPIIYVILKDGSIFIMQNLDSLITTKSNKKQPNKRQKVSKSVNVTENGNIKSSLKCLEIEPPISIPLKPIKQFKNFHQIKYLNPFMVVIYNNKVEFYGNITTECDKFIDINDIYEIEKYNENEFLLVDKFGCIFCFDINKNTLNELISFNSLIPSVKLINNHDFLIHLKSGVMYILNKDIIIKEFEVGENVCNIRCYNNNYIFYISNNTMYNNIYVIYNRFYLSILFPSHFIPISIFLPNISFYSIYLYCSIVFFNLLVFFTQLVHSLFIIM